MAGPPAHLIIVCCHGVWLGGSAKAHDEAEWLIADFQRGETGTFVQHARRGVECLADDRGNSVLVFSGGPTRQETQLSEAQSYANIASQNNHWNLLQPPISPTEILVEDRALDSYHNVLLSLTLFHTRFNAWPAHMTLISHTFKKPRLIGGHCVAIGFPLDRVSFVGIDPPGMAAEEAGGDALVGVARAVGEWRDDPHGRGESLAGKRTRRNPWDVWQGLFVVGENGKGGLITTGEGAEETLVEDEARPWV